MGVAILLLLRSEAGRGDPGHEFYAVLSEHNELSEPLSIYVCNPDPSLTASVVIETDQGPVSTAQVLPSTCAAVLESSARQVSGTALGAFGYRVRSDLPVHAQQHMPFSALLPMTASSLLLDRALLGNEYLVVALRGNTGGYSSVLTVVAPQAARVAVEVSADTVPGPGVPALAAGQRFVADLPELGVLQIAGADNQDLTGSRVTADVPVAVYGGCHRCLVPGSTADYVQESLVPVAMWGTQVVGPASTGPTGGTNLWRVVAGQDATTVTTEPPLTGTPVTLACGQWVDLASDLDVVITATGRILVARIEDQARAYGDPSLTLLIPEKQFTLGGMFTLPTFTGSPLTQWVDVVTRPGASVTVDGSPVPGASFAPIGSSGFLHASVVVTTQDAHVVTSDQPIAAYAGTIAGGLCVGYPVDVRCGEDVPVEVSRTRAPLWLARRGTGVLFSWEDVPGAAAYNVYAGTVRSIWSHSAMSCATVSSMETGGRRTATLAVPPSGYFLVSAANCSGEGETGADPSRSDCPP